MGKWHGQARTRPAPLAAAILVLCSGARAAKEDHPTSHEPRSDPQPTASPLDGLGSNIAAAFSGARLFYHGGALLGTSALVVTGADHQIRVWTQRHLESRAVDRTAYYSGYLLPAVVPITVYLAGHLGDEPSWAGAGSAAIQAVAVTVSTTVLLKIASGRPFPRHGGDPDAPDRLEHPEYAREFSPFSFDGHYAWPSGHTSAAVSLAASLTAYSSHPIVVGLITYPVALGIGAGMIVGDHHWASDVVAGGLMGQAIGWTVGAAFRSRADGSPLSRIQIAPLVGSRVGAVITAPW